MDSDNNLPSTNPAPTPQPQPATTGETTEAQRQAAADITRAKIDALYKSGPANPHITDEQPQSAYDKTHTPVNGSVPAEQWDKYHTAWQTYYQQYYAGYYAHHLKQQQTIASAASPYFSEANTKPENETVSEDEAIFELRQSLLGKVRNSAEGVRRSRHFIPIFSAILVMLVFLFLQYNRLIFANIAAYVSPGSIDPQNIVIDPASTIHVSDEPRLIIPKINVDVPAIYGIGPDHDSQMDAMNKGVAHFAIPGANSVPGQVGNTVLAGHSSNDLFDQGDYKFIFVQLEKLRVGDSIYANYEGVRYSYTVTKLETVKPNEVSKLIYDTDKPMLTLITCTPVGTALNRLLVTAEQVSPDPASAKAADTSTPTTTQTEIPGNSKTLWERLFG